MACACVRACMRRCRAACADVAPATAATGPSEPRAVRRAAAAAAAAASSTAIELADARRRTLDRAQLSPRRKSAGSGADGLVRKPLVQLASAAHRSSGDEPLLDDGSSGDSLEKESTAAAAAPRVV